MKKCYIVGAGADAGLDFVPANGDLVIAADGGYNYLNAAGLEPDILIGDFDSFNAEDGILGCEVIKLKPEKDETDLLAAINKGIEKGFGDFYIYNVTGGRIDHSAAAIQNLIYLTQNGYNARIFTKEQIITVIKDRNYVFDKAYKGIISVFSISEKSYGVTLCGVKYPLDNYTMTNQYPIGVSNEFTGEGAEVSVKDGILLLIFNRQ